MLMMIVQPRNKCPQPIPFVLINLTLGPVYGQTTFFSSST